MAIVFGHVWAIWWWRCTHTRATADSLRVNTCSLSQAPTSAKELRAAKIDEIRQSHLARGFPRDLPMDLVAKTAVPRARYVHIKVRCWNGHVPLGAICTAGSQLTCSPEFCYVLVASDIRRICQESLQDWQYSVVLVELGCELCGTYSKQDTARGFKNRLVPLVSAAQMRDFACSLAHERGAGRAYDALRWVLDFLNSPMETVVYLMLCLPRAWGGLELPRPRSNCLLPVPEELWQKTDARHVKPDLYWVEWGLAVEFFGEEYHEGKGQEDLQRQEIEQDMGLKVVTFWKGDLSNLDRFNAKARSVAQYLGRSLPEPSKKFSLCQKQLMDMLVKHRRWI